MKVKKEGSKKLESNDYELSFNISIKLLLRRTLVLQQFYSVFSLCFGLPQQTKCFLIFIGKPRNDEEPAVRVIDNHIGVRHCEAVF